MDERIGGPVCFVDVEAVLLYLSIVSDEALVVASCNTAFVSAVNAKVKHIPNVGCPEVRTFCKNAKEVFVIICLIFFTVVTLLGV